MEEWLHNEHAEHYVKFLEGLRVSYLNQLARNYLDSNDKRDISDYIRGRIFMLDEMLSLPEQLDSVKKLEAELKQLEAEGYTVDRDPKPQQAARA